MKFRTRLLILLLIVALVPLSVSFFVQRTTILHFGNKLAEDTRSLLGDSAETLLHSLVNNYGRILKRDRTMALLTLQSQARAVEYQLALPLAEHPGKIYFAEDYDHKQTQPDDLQISQSHLREDDNGHLTPIPISFSQQVIFLPPGADREQLGNDISRLSNMARVYRNLHRIQPQLFLWQYTALESGIHSSYPGKGGYPQEYDPRKREWYRAAITQEGVSQRILTDVTTGALILTLAMPVHYPNGSLAGVTALDIDYRQFFSDWKIPAAWKDAAQSMVLIFHDNTGSRHETIEVLLEDNKENTTHNWQTAVSKRYIDLSDERFDAIYHDLRSGRSGVRKVTFEGQETLWAYGPRAGKDPFPLVIVPYNRILAAAQNAEKYVNNQISLSLTISALLTVIVVLGAITVALVRARKVTHPVMQLSQAAERLANGDYSARVATGTGDEIDNLGRIFNDLGVRLEEREQLKQSLALAKEIQQHLLPDTAPPCPGFDLVGMSVYCDETGGDYYDFITSSETDSLGVVVGDVSGHGIGPALVMATARGAVHSLAGNGGMPLSKLFHKLNGYLCRGTSDASFMTLFYGNLNHRTRTLEWLSAGHAPVFFLQNDQVQDLDSSGIPLGISDVAVYDTSETISFQAGDILFIGTDGIWETRDANNQMFGTERLKQLLWKYRLLPADQIAEAILTEISLFRGEAPIEDDVTLLIIKALPEQAATTS